MLKKSEKRRTSRVKFNHPVTLFKKGKRIQGVIENISLKGMYIKVKKIKECTPDEKLNYEIKLSPYALGVKIKGTAKVARRGRKGCGLYFIRMNSDSLVHTRRLLEINFGKPQKITQELKGLLAFNPLRKNPRVLDRG